MKPAELKLDPELLKMHKVKGSEIIPTKPISDSDFQKVLDARSKKANSPKSHARLRKTIYALNNKTIDEVAFGEMLSNLDEYLAGFAPSNSLCKRGCGQCCHVSTAVSYMEALFIAHHTNLEISLNKSIPKEGRCKFLDEDNACSIYEYRPMVCRAFYTVDSWEACYVKDSSHYINTIMSSADLADFHRHIAKEYIHSEGVEFATINQWFSGDAGGRSQ